MSNLISQKQVKEWKLGESHRTLMSSNFINRTKQITADHKNQKKNKSLGVHLKKGAWNQNLTIWSQHKEENNKKKNKNIQTKKVLFHQSKLSSLTSVKQKSFKVLTNHRSRKPGQHPAIRAMAESVCESSLMPNLGYKTVQEKTKFKEDVSRIQPSRPSTQEERPSTLTVITEKKLRAFSTIF